MTREEIMLRLNDHYNEALEHFPEDQIIGIFLQGSQNYGLELPTSDVDTKLIVAPSFEEIAMNTKPVSTTHIRANDEHIDFKDIRLYMQTFRKQNLNFLEILFTPFYIINPKYKDEWMRLVNARESIANFNRYRGVQSMKGIALEKFHAMEHPYPSKIDVIAKYGYDPKQLHHLLRVEDYLERYIAGESYEKCLRPADPNYLIAVKLGIYSLDEARQVGQRAILNVNSMAEEFYAKNENIEDPEVNALLDDVQLNMMRIAIKEEFKK
jgi:hypothetical protein